MTYQSPFSLRYGSDEMRALWSEEAKRRTWRRVWVSAAEAMAAAGLVTAEQVDELRSRVASVDLDRALQIEAQIGHDLMAELKTFAEQCPTASAVIHWGMTSADVEDNADVARQRAALTILLQRLRDLLLALAARMEETAALPVLGYTHLQPAEPTTLGYRFAGYAQDLLGHLDGLIRLRVVLRGKGIKGVVGTSASFVEMLQGTPVTPEMLEATVMEALGIEAFPVTTQTYPRIQDYNLLAALGGLAASLHKLAFDLRLMQSAGIDQAAEPFGPQQVGSSAMPFKRNPVQSEKICSLAREVAAGVSTAWQNAANALLERTLDDSANRRRLIPEAFLACDEMLRAATEIVLGLQLRPQSAESALQAHAPFAASERVLSALVRAGADRQAMHARLREHALAALASPSPPSPNLLADRMCADTALLRYLQPARIRELMDIRSYTGRAPGKTRDLAAQIRARLAANRSDTPA